MAPRWFNNIQFGRDVTNMPLENLDVIENFKANFAQKFQDFTFNSTGPIIEEIEDELPHTSPPQMPPPSPSSSSSTSSSSISSSSTSLSSSSSPTSPSPVLAVTSSPSPVLVVASSSLSSSSSLTSPSPVLAVAASPSPVLPAVASSSSSSSSSSRVLAVAASPPPVLPAVASSSSSSSSSPVLAVARRSQRKRWAPLDFARGERPIYKRNGATFEVVGFEPGFPANYNYSKAKQTATTKQQQQPKARKRPANTIPVDPVDLRPAKKGDYLFACRKNSSLITGAIQLESGKSKPEAKTGINHVYMFLVRSGQVIIKTKDEKETISLYADEHSDWITLDVGKRYSIRNCGSTTAKIAYIVSDRVDD